MSGQEDQQQRRKRDGSAGDEPPTADQLRAEIDSGRAQSAIPILVFLARQSRVHGQQPAPKPSLPVLGVPSARSRHP